MIRQVQVGPLTFDIHYEDLIGHTDAGEEVPIKAMCSIQDLTLTISKLACPVIKLKYIIHEMLEAYNDLYDLQLTHAQINQLEIIYLDMITTNKHLTQAIEEEVEIGTDTEA